VIGKTVSHYKIISKLGEGGMGVVYKAEDIRLDRHVAIKFLPSQLSSDDKAKKRFIREAKAASSLNHANIAVVHEIDETPEGQTFMVMACYEGQTLKDRLETGPLPADEAIAIVSQLASGLSKAHDKGILHRDIKPGNVLMGDDGQAKLADFGLATLAGQTKITKTGTTVGTVSYMSPEQASAGEVDQRSDIFSLGVVLYELLTGSTPFQADHEAAVLYRIMHSDPPPLSNYSDDFPEKLQHVIDMALQKVAKERFGSAHEFLDALGELQSSLSGFPPMARAYRRPRFRSRSLRTAGIALVVVVVAAVAASRQANRINRRASPHGYFAESGGRVFHGRHDRGVDSQPFQNPWSPCDLENVGHELQGYERAVNQHRSQTRGGRCGRGFGTQNGGPRSNNSAAC
jgi:serine/threonine protein kinase